MKPKEKKDDIREREATAVLASLSTPPKRKEKRKRETPLYFEARISARTKTGKPQPPSSSQITTGDAPTSPSERPPSKISVTYERGSPKTTTWKGRLDQSASKAQLKVKETEKREGATPSSPPRAEQAEPPRVGNKEHIPKPSSWPRTRSRSKIAQG